MATLDRLSSHDEPKPILVAWGRESKEIWPLFNDLKTPLPAIFGLAPAWMNIGQGVYESLQAAGGRGGVGERGRMRPALVVADVALTILLLTGAAFFCGVASGSSRSIRASTLNTSSVLTLHCPA